MQHTTCLSLSDLSCEHTTNWMRPNPKVIQIHRALHQDKSQENQNKSHKELEYLVVVHL